MVLLRIVLQHKGDVFLAFFSGLELFYVRPVGGTENARNTGENPKHK